LAVPDDGEHARLDGVTLPIAGVVHLGFSGVDVGRRTDVYLPVCAQPVVNRARPALDRRDGWWLAAFGRLKPGVSIDQATAELTAKSRGIFEATLPPSYEPTMAGYYLANTLIAQPAATGVSSLRTRYATSLTLLLSIAGPCS
jgi:hypothetical protein